MDRPTPQDKELILRRIRALWPEVTAMCFSRSEIHVLTAGRAALADQHLAAANALRIAEQVLGRALSLRWVPDEVWAGP